MSFSSQVKEDALVACGRHCCLCHKFCGLKIEVHHIRLASAGGCNEFENAIPLCFDCHADMRSYDSKHPKGIKYTESELVRHRNSWYAKVKNSQGGVANKISIEHDIEIFNIIMKLLPWDKDILWAKTFNFAGFSFDTERLCNIEKFLYKCDDPGFEYIDTDLEAQRVALKNEVREFCGYLCVNTYPLDSCPGRNSVPSEWEFSDPQRFYVIVETINEKSAALGEAYDALVRLSVRKLGVMPPPCAADIVSPLLPSPSASR